MKTITPVEPDCQCTRCGWRFFSDGDLPQCPHCVAGLSTDQSAISTQVGGTHYKDMAIQPAEFCQKNRLGYLESLAVKYVSRHAKKGKREDLEKAIHCLQMLMEMEYPK